MYLYFQFKKLEYGKFLIMFALQSIRNNSNTL
nr:MAG TPA: hypothetical protein [Bacteriophage sp.]